MIAHQFCVSESRVCSLAQKDTFSFYVKYVSGKESLATLELKKGLGQSV